MFKEIRRKDRIWDSEEAIELLRKGEYGTLSMSGANGYGYGIPMSYVYDEDKLYFHCAPDGFKIDSLALNNKASFSVVGKANILPGQFSTEYRSVMVFGIVELEITDEEKRYALKLIVNKYSHEFKEVASQYINQLFNRTRILRLDVEHISAKHREI
ncbi:MAG: pyridoxamine 5'-phosphate oxidase family protein [Rikenellaceae bacterium]|nr:pyridoxamine 5'-phosphate oxidase family protein [Rikenellaceae bacterium]